MYIKTGKLTKKWIKIMVDVVTIVVDFSPFFRIVTSFFPIKSKSIDQTVIDL